MLILVIQKEAGDRLAEAVDIFHKGISGAGF